MSDAAGTEFWSYDPMGRLWADQRTIDNAGNNVTKTFTAAYNLDGSTQSKSSADLLFKVSG